MAAAEKDKSFLSPLFSAEISTKDVLQLTQKLARRKCGFETVNVEVTALVLILGTQLSRVHNDLSPTTNPTVSIVSGELIKFLFKLLKQEEGDNRFLLPVIKTLHSLVEGTEGLSDSDLELLKGVVKDKERDLLELFTNNKEGSISEDQADRVQSPLGTEEKEEKKESLMLKLYSQMRTSRKKTGTTSSLGTPGKTGGQPQGKLHFTEVVSLLKINADHVKECNGVQTLLNTCLRLSPLPSTTEVTKEAPPNDLLKAHQIKGCVDTCLLATTISSCSSVMSSSTLTDLSVLMRRCVAMATSYTASYVNGTQSAKAVTAAEDDTPPPLPPRSYFPSVSELLRSLSCHQLPSEHTVKNITSDIVRSTIKLIRKIETSILASPKSKVIGVFSAIVAHSILTGLTSLFPSQSGAVGTASSHFKLTPPLCHLLHLAFHLTNGTILDQLSRETEVTVAEDEVKGRDLDINGSYTPWQLACVVLKEVPLVHMLVTSAQVSFKKVLVAAEAPSREGSQTDVTADPPSFSDTKPTRSDQEEHLFNRLQDSLSSKIPLVTTPTKGDSGENKGDSVSPSSTISSSGEVRGEYVINSGGDQQEERSQGEESHEEEEEDDDESFHSEGDFYENLAPFFDVLHLSKSLEATPIPFAPPPPPPPLPPKKARFARPLVPPRLLPPRSIPREEDQWSPTQKKMTLYLRLTNTAIRCLLEGLVQSSHGELQKYLTGQFKPCHASVLSWLFLNVHSLSTDSKNSHKFVRLCHFSDLSQAVTDLLHEMVVSGIVSAEYHGSLLRDIGLHPACWPLNVPTPTLSLLARVLICRLQVCTDNKDDPLTLGIWNGFLSTLEDNAANEVVPDEDLSVSHLQLLLLVWHNFSSDTRRDLLLKCVKAVNRVAEEKGCGVVVPPIAVTRLLLVLQYMVYQFSEPATKLSEQVNGNLLTDSPRPSLTPPIISPEPALSDVSGGVMCYSCDQQMQYQRVVTKPGFAPKDAKCTQHTNIHPLFYNVIPSTKFDSVISSTSSSDDGNEEGNKPGVDSDACQILLKCGEGAGTYDKFCHSLLSIMSCGTDYKLHSEDVYSRLAAACAGHQCVDLCLSLLTSLPPSFSVLSSAVENSGLNFKDDSNSSNRLILLYMLSVKLHLQQIDIEDIVDTLTESGHGPDESEELVGRVMSIVGSTDHFVSQSLTVMEGFLSMDEDNMLPLMPMMAINLLFCLLERTIQETVKVTTPIQETREEQPATPTDPKKVPTTGETEKDQKEADSKKIKTLSDEFYVKHGSELVGVVLKVVNKLISFAHMYVCRGDARAAGEMNEDIERVVRRLMSVSGSKFVSIKTKDQLPFFSHIPLAMKDNLKAWNSASPLGYSLLDKIRTSAVDQMNLFDVLWILDISLSSLAVQHTFDPARCLKTAILTGLMTLSSLLMLRPKEEGVAISEDIARLLVDLVTEFAMEKCGSDPPPDLPLKDMAVFFGKGECRRACLKLRLLEYFRLVSCPELDGHTFQGVIVEDLFVLMGSLLDSPEDWAVIAELDNTPEANIADLFLLCSRSSVSGSTLAEGLQLMVKILRLSDENPQDHMAILVLCSQVASLGLVGKDKLLSLLRRIIIGSSNESVGDIASHTKLLKKFVELLTKDDSLIPSLTCQSFLTALLPLGQELVDTLKSDNKMLTVFKDYITSCILLAGRHSDPGHVGLARAAIEWLPGCVELAKPDWSIDSEMLSPLLSLMGYLSNLTTSLELATNKCDFLERRDNANEDEYSILETGDDDDSVVDEEEETLVTDEESLNDTLCTFTVTKREFKNQHWYHCHTCKLIDGTGCCSVCVKVCHKGHDVTYSKFGSFFCDCGAKEDGSCKALVKRAESSSRAESPVSGSDGNAFSEPRRKGKTSSKKEVQFNYQVSCGSQSAQMSSQSQTTPFPTPTLKRIIKQIESYKNDLKALLVSLDIPRIFMPILQNCLPKVVSHRSKKAFGTADLVRDALCSLHQKKKKIEPVDNIIPPTFGCQDNAVESVKLSLSGDQGQLIKQLLSNTAARRSAMCATVTSKGQGQLLAISQDKGKVSFYQLSSLLKQAESYRRKLALSRIGTMTVPFTILSLASNPSCEDYLVVCGVKECQVLTVSSTAQVTDKLKLQLSIGANGYLVKVFWLPGSQTDLVVVADTFVKIYDLSCDVISPAYYFTVFSDKIKDACVIVTDESKYLVVMMSTGHLYCQPVVPECGASDGPIYFTIEMTIDHTNIKETGNMICEGGVSVFYSHSLELLFLSYQNGKSFMVTLDKTMCKSKDVVQLNLINNTTTNNGKTTPTPLTEWTDSHQHPGLVCALTASTCNLVTFVLKPEVIQMHESKALSVKAKIQGLVMIRPPSTGELQNPAHTTLLTVSEDGSVRAYPVNNTDSVQYWLRPQFQPVTPLAYLSLQTRRRAGVVKRRSSAHSFPVDFFEHCQRMQNTEVDFLGNDILHIYNKEQVKHRFNVGGLYIANTKPGGFTIDVQNLQSDSTVMVGLRVLLGGRSVERSPSTIEVFGRSKQVTFPSNNARWFDIPFAREESLQADKTFKLTFGPSLDPSGINMIDCVRVYIKNKDDFGWPEKPSSSALSLVRRRGEEAGTEEMGDTGGEVLNTGDGNRFLGSLEKLLCYTFSVLGNRFLSSPVSDGVTEVAIQATPLLGLNIPYGLQYHAKFFVSCAIRDPLDYNVCKNHLQLSHAQVVLNTEPRPEQYQNIIIILLVIARLHPQNLCFIPTSVNHTLNEALGKSCDQSPDTKGDGCGLWKNIVKQLNELFWLYYHKRPVNSVTCSVLSMGLIAVESTVCLLVELMWCIVCQYPEALSSCVPHFIKLLTSSDTQIGPACVKTMMKLLKPRPPKLSTPDPPPVAVEEPTKGKDEEGKEEPDHTPKRDSTPTVPQQPPVQLPIDLESVLANPAAAMDQLMSNPAMLGMMPDEEAMMNFAIAMSLHEEGNSDSVQAMQSALEGLGLPVPPSLPQIEEPNDPSDEEEQEERGVVSVQDDPEGKDSAQSLNSSYEDLVIPGGDERGGLHSPMMVVRRRGPGRLGQGGKERSAPQGDKKKRASGNKQTHDPSSEHDIPIDSSGEEDAEDPSFLEMSVYDQFEKSSSDHTPSTSVAKGGGDSHTQEHLLRMQLLTALADHLSDVEEVGGARSIPYLQLILFLSSCLKGSHGDGETFTFLLKKLVARLQMEEVDVAPMMARSSQSEVLLLLLRFFNIIMSRKRMKVDKLESASANRLWYSTADTLLQSQCMGFCLRILQGILKSKLNFKMEEVSVKCDSNLLKPRSHTASTDMGPFFQQQYVKSHSSDVFETYSYLLADIALALPCQLKRFCEKTNSHPALEFNTEWMETLCQYFMASSQTSSSGKKQIRKVLVYVCGSKEKYRLVRDKYALQSHFSEIIELCSGVKFDPSNPSTNLIHLPYNSLKKLIEQLRLCDDIAKNRTKNWQSFCLEQKNSLVYLFLISLAFDEGLVPTILQLLHSALSGVHTSEEAKDPSKRKEGDRSKKDKSGKDKKPEEDASTREEQSVSLTQMFFEALNDDFLLKFLKRFLLQSNSSNVRWQCHTLVHTLYKHSPSAKKVHIVQLLWNLWPNIRGCGHKASQFVDLLGYCTISSPEVLAKDNMCGHLVRQAVELLRRQNSSVQAHPNSHVYSQLSSLVDFDGYYLESDPCLVCNDPEVPFTMTKLYSMKSEIRYSPNTIFLKLNGSYMFSHLHMKINEIRRSKMIRVMNLYYSNRTVQNVIELKNNRSLWLKGASCTLQQSQGDVKLDFPLPIVARNLIIEYADFYESGQIATEVLQCPRCNTSVPAHPGVCAACGENVHQCHKCRAINYDERDPFLCNSCGFSKYARFDVQVETRPCSAVDPIDNEDDKKKTLSNINQLLDKADSVYKELVQHRNQMDSLLVALASGTVVISRSGTSESGVNKAIQAVAQLYCQNCKTCYQDLSKTIQSVLASRRELVTYDMKKLQTGRIPSSEPSTPITPASSGEGVSLSFPLSGSPHSEGNCYGCSSATLEHCITILKALAFKQETRKLLVDENLIEELVEFNLRSGSADLHKDVQRLLCQLTRDNLEATKTLNEFITRKVLQHIKYQRISPNLISEVQPEIQLLTASIAMEDSCWEARLRAAMLLFRKSRGHTSPVVMAAVTMPCLKIIHSLINPKTSVSAVDRKKMYDGNGGHNEAHSNVTNWLREDPECGFMKWKESVLQLQKESDDSKAARETELTRKYSRIWIDKTLKSKVSPPVTVAILKQSLWMKGMLFNASSQAARKMACNILYSLCDRDTRQRQILDLLSTFLDQVGSAGEASKEYLELFQKLTQDETGRWKLYLAKREILLEIGKLIVKEIDYLLKLEESTLSSDLSQGYALRMLTVLLKSFLAVDSIKNQYKSKLVKMVLNGYLSLKRLVTQRTKRIDECQKLLLKMLEDLTSGTEVEKHDFLRVCVETLANIPMSDTVTPIFLFEQICNIILPEEEDIGEFFLSLDKDPQQEEFLQGRMQGNPYSSEEVGLGPLMRDIKNRICTDCELVALLEDDTGMELLVCNKIISLDLPVKEVYKKIWCAQPNAGQRMKVVYRMRGLLGDATEDMVEKLGNGEGKDVNEEEVYKMAATLETCNGLDAILTRLSHAKDFIQSHGLIAAGLKLLGYCSKVKVNRQYLITDNLNTLNILLGILNMSLQYEQLESNGIGAAVAQQVLSVTEPILQESSSQQRVIVRTISEEAPTDIEEDDSRLSMLLSLIESSFVQSNLSVREGLMQIIPFLTFGDPKNMTVLLKHFAPYLDFEKYDTERGPENSLYLDCFCAVASGIGKDDSGVKLKDLAIEMKITTSAIEYIQNKTPTKGVRLESKEWAECVGLPSLPYVLKMLVGLCQNHSKTQLMVCGVVSQIHLLEQVSSTQHHIGTLAETLLETMRENAECKEMISKVRKETREEKKKRAMEMRAKELGALGFQVNEKGQLIAKTPTAFKDIEKEVVEETGLRCCICLEGYRNQPQKILGIYTFTKKVTLDEFENKPRKTQGCGTVSHFNVVHYDCHSSAIKLARSRDEWESATLQNANTRCNGILPIWGPSVSDSAFSSSLARHNAYIQECTGLYDPSFKLYAHDIRLLLSRYSYETSFSSESGGGGPQSNLHLVPYLVHVSLYIIDTTRVYQREEKHLNNVIANTHEKWVPSSYELDGPLYSVTLSLLIMSLPQWEEHKLAFLRQLLVLAHARSVSSTPIKGLPSPDPAPYNVYRPVLILFALVDGLHRMLKKSLIVTGPELLTAILDFVRNNDIAIGEECDKLLTMYQDELLPIESFEEFCDVNGLLAVIPNPGAFLKALIASVAN